MKKKMIRILYLLVTLSLVVSCQSGDDNKVSGLSNHREQIKVEQFSQENARIAREKINEMKEVDRVQAVAVDDQLYISMSVSGVDRLFLKRIREQAHKIAKESTNAKNIHVSTDKKIVMELTTLEEKVSNRTITKKELETKTKKIEKDMKG